MAASAGAVRAGKAYVELFATDNALVRGLKAAEKKVKAWGAGLQRVGGGMMGAGLGVEAGLGVAVGAFTQAGSGLDRLSASTGVSVERLSELNFAATQLGGSAENVSGALGSLQGFVEQLRRGSTGAFQTLRWLGVSFDEVAGQGVTLEQSFAAVNRGLAGLEASGRHGSAVSSLAAIYGQGGESLRVFTQLPGQFDALAERARRLGLVMGGDDAQAATQLGAAWSALKQVGTGLAVQIGAALAPTLINVVGYLLEGAAVVMGFVRAHREWFVWAAKIAAVVAIVGGVLVAFGTALGVVGMVLGGIATGVSVVIGVISGLISGVVTVIGVLAGAVSAVVTFIAAVIPMLPIILAVAVGLALIVIPIAAVVAGLAYLVYESGILGAAWTYLSETFQEAWQAIKDFFAPVIAEMTATWEAFTTAIGANDWEAAWNLIKAAFSAGWIATMNVLKSAWRETRDWLLDTWDTLVLGMTITWRGFRDSFLDLWDGAVRIAAHYMVDLVKQMRSILPRAVANRLFGSSGTLELAIGRIENQANQRREERRQQRQADNEADAREAGNRAGARQAQRDAEAAADDRELQEALNELHGAQRAANAAGGDTGGGSFGGGGAGGPQRPRLDSVMVGFNATALSGAVTTQQDVQQETARQQVGLLEGIRDGITRLRQLAEQNGGGTW